MMRHLEDKYNEDMDDFFNSTLEDPDFPDKAERWRASQRTMLRLARTLMRRENLDPADEQKAFQMVDRVLQDALLLEANMKAYYQHMEKNDVKAVNKVHRIWTAAQDHLIRIDATCEIMECEMRFGPDYWADMEEANKRDAKMFGKMDLIPKGHIYRAAQPYPPLPIPAGEPVPPLPEPYQDFLDLDPEALDYDEEHDEYFIAEGYVSEDGRLDHNSVIWDWEKEEVTFQYVGGPPVTWKFWKARCRKTR